MFILIASGTSGNIHPPTDLLRPTRFTGKSIPTSQRLRDKFRPKAMNHFRTTIETRRSFLDTLHVSDQRSITSISFSVNQTNQR